MKSMSLFLFSFERNLVPKAVKANMSFRFYVFVTKIDTACLCYSVFCDLDVKDRSCIARKERFLFW